MAHILVTNTSPIRDGNRLVTACSVAIKGLREANAWDALDAEITVRMIDGVWDQNANAFVAFIPRAEIDAAIAKIRARWGGDLPVRQNLPEHKIR